jgi:HD-GYP domain-containing protein (c-di-GMP phosphodiesterase class II)
MRLAKLGSYLEDKRLATAIKSRDGKKLVNEGAILSIRLIERLLESGLSAVYIEDDNYNIEVQESIDGNKHAKIYTKVQEIFMKMERMEFNYVDLMHFIRTNFLPEIKNGPISIPADQIMEKEDLVQHSINVAMLSVRTAMLLGFAMDKIEMMAFIALLHDIGKVIKNKNAKLKDIPHYEVAFDFLKKKNCTVLSYMSIRFQEENYDGSGMYKISKDKQIDFARILSICDHYETLMRTGNLMPYECYERTQALVNSKFDPEVFKAFRDSIYIYPVGLPVLLNNKVEGVIIRQNESYPLRPIIKAVDQYYNLMENLSLFIQKVAI